MNATNNVSVQSSGDGETLRNVKESPNNRLTIDIAASAVFGAVSLVLTSFVVPTMPRVAGWQIAFFDPVSLIWITAFLIFGLRAGILTTIIGAFGLLPFDPSGWIGPIMKFSATIWFILIPYYFSRKVNIKDNRGSKALQNPKRYYTAGAIAWVIRLGVMLMLNYLFLKYVWNALDFMTLSWLGYDSITGIQAVVITVLILNTIQTLGDLVVPFLIVNKTPLKEYQQW